MYVCIYVCRYVRAYVGLYVCMYVCMYVRTYARTHVRTYVCMYEPNMTSFNTTNVFVFHFELFCAKNMINKTIFKHLRQNYNKPCMLDEKILTL